jgi:hypothetical protein
MFPTNGALIKTERHTLKTSKLLEINSSKFTLLQKIFQTNFTILANNNFITSSVIKDEHTFSIHIVDPVTAPATTESSIKISEPLFGNASASNLDMKSYIESSIDDKSSLAKYIGFTGVMKDGMSLSVSSQSVSPKCNSAACMI